MAALGIKSHTHRRNHSVWMNHAICVVLSLIFLTAAIAKTISFRELEATLGASRLVPILLTQHAGVFLLVTGYLLSLLLLVPTTRRAAVYAATVLVRMCAASSTRRWLQGISVPSNCFGVIFKQLQLCCFLNMDISFNVIVPKSRNSTN